MPTIKSIPDEFLGDSWESFEKAMLQDAGERQRSAMRMAFYSGAYVTFQILITMSKFDYPAKEGAQVILNLEQELNAFLAATTLQPTLRPQS